ncbi:transposase [Plakobranchus ocellatus]|uniref:Transposase n=1 Tax=Plakobranchus ocellatus TaxID=259542 RepID=A0AAV4BIN9_9GAST|nr:transposase [Plakobranchus ocellatus]
MRPLIQQTLHSNGYDWEILPHPAHSPDLAPFDFHLFGPLKRHLGGMAFETEDDLIMQDNLRFSDPRQTRALLRAQTGTHDREVPTGLGQLC